MFFLDEAVALAAGHRPCGQCRHADYGAFKAAWTDAFGAWPGPSDADHELHSARACPGARYLRHHQDDASNLPPGAMCRTDQLTLLITRSGARVYQPEGYGPLRPRPTGRVTVLTNPVTLNVLRAGYAPMLHASART
ncbi:hypothetical protein [Jannaschia sp. 2305UL9-9]|uniref:hypothetical protein n=1 Tax=Jannaschia sp. 2305UL9-9 TaxID=3121638 RepID=UPI003527406E